MAKILCAMSGGVDSSSAAALVSKSGHEVIGVHMRLHDVESDDPKSCCGQKDARDAAAVCEMLNIPFFVHDMRKAFRASVLRNFIDEYNAGRTPIPCTHCNGTLKFNLLVHLADIMGCDYVATGHYAYKQEGNRIFRATDANKDQSYFLWNIPQKFLGRIVFPIGSMTKEVVRELAEEWDLPNANKPESQDLCFVPGSHKDFLSEFAAGSGGKFIDWETGEVLGYYADHTHYTVGQSKGLRVSTGKRWFVKQIHPTSNVIYLVDSLHKAETHKFKITGYHLLEETEDIKLVQVRHRGRVVNCSLDIDTMTVSTEEPIIAAPGQAAVFYSTENQLLGGGWIASINKET